MTQSNLRTDPQDATLIEILDRILDKGIVLESWARVVSGITDFSNRENRITVAPERRRKPFLLPTKKREH